MFVSSFSDPPVGDGDFLIAQISTMWIRGGAPAVRGTRDQLIATALEFLSYHLPLALGSYHRPAGKL